MWCCNCGKKGHHQIHCQLKKELSFPDTIPFVSSYECTFNEQEIVQLQEPSNKNGFVFNEIYKPLDY